MSDSPENVVEKLLLASGYRHRVGKVGPGEGLASFDEAREILLLFATAEGVFVALKTLVEHLGFLILFAEARKNK